LKNAGYVVKATHLSPLLIVLAIAESRAVHAHFPLWRQSRNPLLAQIVFGVDAVLRRRNCVFEYSSDQQCILRISLSHLDSDVALNDGTRGRAGDPIIELHLWNEQVPASPKQGASIGWARQMHLCFSRSLAELAQYLAIRPEHNDISIVRANLALGGSKETQRMARLISRYGFEPMACSAPAIGFERAQRFGENVLISLMVLAHNAAALRRDTLSRARLEAWLSRRRLEQRYGGLSRSDSSVPAASRQNDSDPLPASAFL
jgi:hypothetical protein